MYNYNQFSGVKKLYGLIEHTDEINRLLARYGVKFGIYKNNVFNERLFPFDAVPRIISKDEFDYLERGLKQRVKALNIFLKDIYTKKQIIKDKIIPEEFVYGAAGYMMYVTAIHAHQYSDSVWDSEEDGHWHPCIVPGCPDPNEEWEGKTLI